jgi:transposase
MNQKAVAQRMLKMDQVHVIRHKVLIEGQSIRRVASQMNVSRNTVKKYLNQSEPRRVERSARPRPVLDTIKPVIDALLEDWDKRTTRKQRITATRLHTQLREEGHHVGITVVRDYLRMRQRSAREVMIPLIWDAGDAAQIDFFEVTVDLAGSRCKKWMFLMRLMYSGNDFAWLYDRCDQVSFLDGHARSFIHFGAVPHRCIYDNLSAAVRRRTGAIRELTGRFQALVSHYLFEACFARVGEGHDKGGVESRGRGIRLTYLTPIPCGESLDAINTWLLARLVAGQCNPRPGKQQSIATLFTEEQSLMLPLAQSDFDARKRYTVQIYSSSRIRVEGAWYSVPCQWSRSEAVVWVGVDSVEIGQGQARVCHPRTRPNNESISYRHYLPELAKKPQAMRQVATPLLRELGHPFGELWRLLVDCHGPHDAARVFCKVLAAIVEHGESPVAQAVCDAMRVNDNELTLLARLYAPTTVSTLACVPAALAEHEIESAKASNFDVLLQQGSAA